MDISMDIHEKSVDMDMDMDVIFHIHGNPADLTTVCKKVAFLSSFFDAVELEYRYVLLLSDKYSTTKHQSFVSAVHEHFGDIVLARN